MEEWDYIKNRDLCPEDVSFGSQKKVWWVCLKESCNYSWQAQPNGRTRIPPQGCPVCSGSVVSDKNRLTLKFPELLEEWDYIKNEKLCPKNVSYGSEKKVWWICRKEDCKYGWAAVVKSRTRKNPTGCPACVGQVVTLKNRLSVVKPALLDDWDYSRNVVAPEEVSFGSVKSIWWKCWFCKHSWKAMVNNRYNGSGCPACSNRVVTTNNNLSVMFPELVKEWDEIKNGSLKPENVVPGTHKKAWWKCGVCRGSWGCCIKDRSFKKSGCPFCSKGPVSKVSQRWLDSLGIKNLHREYYIKELKTRVDGFDPKTNTVYEFLGDYWHGNPEKYSPEKINPNTKKPFGKLHKKTLDRLRLLEKVGFKVIYIWENDFNRSVKWA